jgi:hypothetical protein
MIPPSSNAVVVRVRVGLFIAGAAAGVWAAAPIVELSTKLISNFFIVAPELPKIYLPTKCISYF